MGLRSLLATAASGNGNESGDNGSRRLAAEVILALSGKFFAAKKKKTRGKEKLTKGNGIKTPQAKGNPGK